ncbi:MAG: hypothetical protein SGJ24_00830 [Chloroflexota bacterium]|nr:hypothetical protein [Chloroflexota bacterium]
MDNALRTEALVNDQLDVVLLNAPQMTIYERLYAIEPLLGVNEARPNATISLIMFGPRMFEGDLGERYLTALLQGSRQANEGATPRNVELFAAATNADPDIIAATCWGRFAEDGKPDLAFLQDYADWLVARGDVDAPIDVNSFYDPIPAELAYASLQAMTPEATEAPSG